MKLLKHLMNGIAGAAALATGAMAADLTIVHGSVGRDQEVLRSQLGSDLTRFSNGHDFC